MAHLNTDTRNISTPRSPSSLLLWGKNTQAINHIQRQYMNRKWCKHGTGGQERRQRQRRQSVHISFMSCGENNIWKSLVPTNLRLGNILFLQFAFTRSVSVLCLRIYLKAVCLKIDPVYCLLFFFIWMFEISTRFAEQLGNIYIYIPLNSGSAATANRSLYTLFTDAWTHASYWVGQLLEKRNQAHPGCTALDQIRRKISSPVCDHRDCKFTASMYTYQRFLVGSVWCPSSRSTFSSVQSLRSTVQPARGRLCLTSQPFIG